MKGLQHLDLSLTESPAFRWYGRCAMVDRSIACFLRKLKSFPLPYVRNTSETRKQVRKVTSMKQLSEDTRRKMSESAKLRCQSPEWIEKQRNRGIKLDLEKFKQLYYEKNMTQKEVADAFGVSQKVVFKFMRRNDLPARVAAKRHQRGEANSYWKGGKRITEQGYVDIYMPEYPHTQPNGYVREHILVAEKMLGRELVFYGRGDSRNEVVHHINGNKTDNRPENLLVMTAGEHMRLHHASTKEMVDKVLLERIRDIEKELYSVRLNLPEGTEQKWIQDPAQRSLISVG